MSQSSISYIEATLVLELLTPLHIGSGEADGGSDAGVVRDFNGLPGIPGTSVQGMLRSECEEMFREHFTDRVFGASGTSNRGTGRGGRLWVGWGVVHASDNKPASFSREPLDPLATRRLTPAERDSDPVLRDAAQPMLRDHACLNGRGVADGRAKFDELVVSAGHRFTVKLRFATANLNERDRRETKAEPDTMNDWDRIDKILRNPSLRLGGKTRRGLGSFKVVQFTRNGGGLPESSEDSRFQQAKSAAFYEGELLPKTLWMFGGGASDFADSAPVSGTRIEWDSTGRGRVMPVWIIPGSGIKGALRHRTKFHANRFAGHFIDKKYESPQAKEHAAQKAERWMEDLFGKVAGNIGVPGKVFIDDAVIPRQTNGQLAAVQNHVSINPFTSGAKDSALFNDEPLRPTAGAIPLRVELRDSNEMAEEALQALTEALRDLCEGRLNLGAHAGRGYGIVKGTPPT